MAEYVYTLPQAPEGTPNAYEGDVIRPPSGVTGNAQLQAPVLEILASMNGYTQKGVTLRANSGSHDATGAPVAGTGTVAVAGSLVIPTGDGKYAAIAGEPPDPRVVKGFLRDSVDLTRGDRLGNAVIMGVIDLRNIPQEVTDFLVASGSMEFGGRVISDNNGDPLYFSF